MLPRRVKSEILASIVDFTYLRASGGRSAADFLKFAVSNVSIFLLLLSHSKLFAQFKGRWGGDYRWFVGFRIVILLIVMTVINCNYR